ncbi:hypothetical protein D3C71_2229720 [compost metagenome]
MRLPTLHPRARLASLIALACLSQNLYAEPASTASAASAQTRSSNAAVLQQRPFSSDAD